MTRVLVSTQAEFEAAINANNDEIELVKGSFRFEYRGGKTKFIVNAAASFSLICFGTSQPHVEARETSQPHVEAWETSQPHVEAWGMSQPHVEAWGMSQPHVVAWETSQPHVVAWETSQPHVVARETSQPHVVAWGMSQPHVEAWGMSQPHVVARGMSQPHVEAWETSQPHVVARETSQPHVVAWGFVQASLFGKAIKAKATAKVAVLLDGGAKCKGGKQTTVRRHTPKEWCDFYGVEVKDGIATLYKAVDEDFSTRNARPKSIFYSPGTTPSAPDWDGGKQECGKGLHFSPSPLAALSFNAGAKHFVACPVALKDFVVHPNGDYPEKVKGKGVSKPVYEVDRYGNPIAAVKKDAA